jgi:hypothetical protein
MEDSIEQSFGRGLALLASIALDHSAAVRHRLLTAHGPSAVVSAPVRKGVCPVFLEALAPGAW